MIKALRWIGALAYAGALTLLLLTPAPLVPRHLFWQADKVAHFFGLGLLGAVLVRAMTRPKAIMVPTYALAVVIGLGSVYAVSIEFLQGAMHRSRTFSVWDIFAGVLGILVLTLAWASLRIRWRLIR